MWMYENPSATWGELDDAIIKVVTRETKSTRFFDTGKVYVYFTRPNSVSIKKVFA